MESSAKAIFPNSWFRIATSKEITVNKIVSLRYFNQDLILFRNAEGKPRVLDAHCPHLGAHLGYGGKLEKNTIRCPYHGWIWDEEGNCTHIPYSDRQPETQIKSYPTLEVNGLIFMYYHNRAEVPTWEIPPLKEYNSSQWTPLKFVRRWQARTDLKNYLDNSVDVAHLAQVHSQTFSAAQSNVVDIKGLVFTHRMSQKYNLSSMASGGLIGEYGSATTTYYGPGYDVSYYYTKGKLELGLLQIFTGTPIDDNYLDIQIFLSIKKALPAPLNRILAAMLKKDTIATFQQDIPILEHKIYQTRPLLVNEDGPIGQSRRWVSQFYQ